jgi:hypothetical protein
LTENRAMSVQTTTARSIQETTFIIVPLSSIGAVLRIARARSAPPSILVYILDRESAVISRLSDVRDAEQLHRRDR